MANHGWQEGWVICLPRLKPLASHGWLWLGSLFDHQIGWPKPMAKHGWPEGWAIGLPRPKPLGNHGWSRLVNHGQPTLVMASLSWNSVMSVFVSPTRTKSQVLGLQRNSLGWLGAIHVSFALCTTRARAQSKTALLAVHGNGVSKRSSLVSIGMVATLAINAIHADTTMLHLVFAQPGFGHLVALGLEDVRYNRAQSD